MKDIVLDAGALVAIEHDDRALWAVLRLAALQGTDVRVPTTVLAQVWRGGARQARLSAALAHFVLSSFDDVAREVGELCGRAKTADICDAHVALVAARHGRVLYTSDPMDMRRLGAALGVRMPIIVRC